MRTLATVVRTSSLGVALVCATAGVAAAQTPVSAPADDPRITLLLQRVNALEAQVSALQAKLDHPTTASTATITAAAPASSPAPQPVEQGVARPVEVATTSVATAPRSPATSGAQGTQTGGVIADALEGMTVNVALDTYYAYNFDHTLGRINALRAYDVSGDSFSLNQADIVLESAADPDQGKRWGLRLDLQYGQATASLQGNTANELRPDLYRAIYQAYGTYVIPLGSGLTVDFGKWSSSLGIEGNYTKDQMNYSRSFWFDFLPFYHTGLRAAYQVNSLVGVNLWITNGTQQTETFNNYKDQLYGLVLSPTPDLKLTLNYYRGQEHPDFAYLQNPTPAQMMSLPNQQGAYILPLVPRATGLLNIADTYATWRVTPKLTLAAEGDYVEERLFSSSPAQVVWGGAGYVSYQLTPKLTLAARAEYLNDADGLYSGAGQRLEELTLSVDYRPEDGVSLRGEFRRDASSRPFFFGDVLGRRLADQPTIDVGAVWWFGQKQGGW